MKVNLSIRIEEEYRQKINTLAEKEGLSQGDFILFKCLGLLPVRIEKQVNYPMTRKTPGGGEKTYNRYGIKIDTVYMPAKNVLKKGGKNNVAV